MEANSKAVMWSAITAVVVLIATTLVTNFMDGHEEGAAAVNAQEIRAIVSEELAEKMKMPDGKTFGQKLTEINDNQIAIKTNQAVMKEALKALSED